MEPTPPPPASNQQVVMMIRSSLESDYSLSSLEVEVVGVSMSSPVSKLSVTFEGRHLKTNLDIDVKKKHKIVNYVMSNCNPEGLFSGTRDLTLHIQSLYDCHASPKPHLSTQLP